jgi:hypothetical protein
MEMLTMMLSTFSPLPEIRAGAVHVPPPQPGREAPFNWTPIVAIGVVTLLGVGLMMKTRKRK